MTFNGHRRGNDEEMIADEQKYRQEEQQLVPQGQAEQG